MHQKYNSYTKEYSLKSRGRGLFITGLQENIFHKQALGLCPLKMDKPWACAL